MRRIEMTEIANAITREVGRREHRVVKTTWLDLDVEMEGCCDECAYASPTLTLMIEFTDGTKVPVYLA